VRGALALGALSLMEGTGCRTETPPAERMAVGLPHVVVIFAEGVTTPGPRLLTLPIQGHMEPAAARPDLDQEAWLSGVWPMALLGASAASTPNTLDKVMSLYGYRTAALLGPGTLEGSKGSKLDRLERSGEERCPSAWAPTAIDVLAMDPRRPTLLVIDTAATACPDWDNDLGHLLDALQPALGQALVLVEPAPGTAGPFALTAPGVTPRRVVGQTIDVLSTALVYAGAVVPSDTQGTALGSTEAGQGRPTFTIGDDLLRIQASGLVITLPKPATGWPGVLPESPPLEATATQDDRPLAVDDPSVVKLWAVIRTWYERMRAQDARSRMGSAAFEKMLKEQGYW
jgi:hypothetical protein